MVDGDDLRSRLDAMATAALVEVLKRQDLDEWRPEVFPVVESILRDRGVDVAELKASAERDRAAARADDRTFVRVMELPDPGALAIAKSLLQEAGVDFFIKNEETQALFGWGQLGTGYNVIIGPPVVMVDSSRVDEVRDLLAPLLKPVEPEGEGG
jgi:putative signal transducing protein